MMRFLLPLIIAVATAAAPGAATAHDVVVPVPAAPSIEELQIQRDIRQREEFQLEQRLNREVDRLNQRRSPIELDVPKMVPSCPQDRYGKRSTGNCR